MYFSFQSTMKDFGSWLKDMMVSAEGYGPKIIAFFINVLIALILLLIGKFIVKRIVKVCDKCFTRTKMEISIRKFLDSLIKVVLYLILVIIVCSTVGINTTSFIAVLGSAGLALGLALQGSLSNFAGGVLILATKPFKVGDYICDKGSGQEGTVNKIDIFYTNLITIDNKSITIPNGSLANSSVTNYSAFDTRRVSICVDISYDGDIDKAKKLMVDEAMKEATVLKDKEIFAFVNTLGASGVTMELRVWVKTSDYWTATFNLNENIKKAYDANDVEIPFNQLVVHMKDNK